MVGDVDVVEKGEGIEKMYRGMWCWGWKNSVDVVIERKKREIFLIESKCECKEGVEGSRYRCRWRR